MRPFKQRRALSSQTISLALSSVMLMAAIPVLAQHAPPSPDRPWRSSDERKITEEGRRVRRAAIIIERDKAYSLAELIDLAEANNPETRVAWEGARAQAAALGIARSELFPTLSAVALSGIDREEIPLGTHPKPYSSACHAWCRPRAQVHPLRCAGRTHSLVRE